jgi:hypothetical protein
MTWAIAAVAGATLVGGYMQSQAVKSAAQTQADAAARAQGQLLATGQEAADLYNPYTSKGITALNTMSTDPYFTRQFNNQDLNANLAPNYAFQLGQGQRANMMASNATGGMVGGNAQKALQDYTQDYAGNAYQRAFENFNQQRQNVYGNLNTIAGYGMTGTEGQANAMLGTGTNIANVGIGASNAVAGSQVAQGQIYGGAANTLGNIAYMGAQNYNQASPYSNMGISGNNASGYTYNSQVGPTESGGNLSQLRI